MHIQVNRDSFEPLYYQIREALRMEIVQGRLQPNQRIPAELTLAEQYGVSRITTRQAIADLVNDGLLYRMPGKGTFVADLTNNVTRPGRKIALILPTLSDFYGASLVSAVQKEAKQEGVGLLLYVTNDSREEEIHAIEDAISHKVSGILSFPATLMLATDYHQVLQQNISLVMLDRYLPDLDCDYVVSDNFGGAYSATEHLIRLNHRQIAIISEPINRYTTFSDRYAGYRQVFIQHGYELPPSIMDYSTDDLERFAERLEIFIRSNKITAIFAFTDFIAMDVMSALKRIGFSTPDNIAVVGFDDIVSSAYLDIPLTTVRQNMRSIGQMGAQLLFERILQGRSQARRIVLPTELVVRKSCGSITDIVNK